MTWDEVEPYYDQFEHIYGVHGKAGNLDGEIQPGRQSARRPALARVSESADEAHAAGRDLREGGDRARLRAVPGAGRRHDPGLQQSLQGDAARMPARRLLLEPRVRAGREGESPHRGAARPLQAEEFRAASALQRHQGQHRFHRQAGDRRDLHRCPRPRGRAAGRASWCWRPTASTTRGCCCSPASASRTIRRPASGVVGRNYSYQIGGRVHVFFDDKEFNPFIGGGMVNTSIDELNGDVIDRSNARLRRRRLYQHAELRRLADQVEAAAARHAALGRGVEEGGRAQLPAHARHPHPRLLHELSRSTTSISIRPTRTPTACRCCA